MPGSSKWYLFLRFPHQNMYTPLLSPIRATYPAHLILLVLITRIIFREEYISLSSPIRSFFPLPCYLVPLRAKNSPQHPILKHPQPTFLPRYKRPSFTHTTTTGKITVLYILIFKFLDSKLEDKRFCTE